MKIYGPGTTTVKKEQLISNEEVDDILKIVQDFEDSNIILKAVTNTIKIEQKNTKEDF